MLAGIFSILAVCLALWVLVFKSKGRTQRVKALCVAVLLSAFCIPMIRLDTSWSLIGPDSPGLQLLASVFAYFGLVIACWFWSEEGIANWVSRAIAIALVSILFNLV